MACKTIEQYRYISVWVKLEKRIIGCNDKMVI